jgi:hypothetical protein
MRGHRIVPHLVTSVAITALVFAPEARAQAHGHDAAAPASGYRAELISDIDELEEKFLGLASAMTGKYAWSPSEGVRSVSQVFMHMASGNFMLPTMAGVMPPEGIKAGNMEEMVATMRELEAITDEAKVKETVQHSFESIAYARMNEVVPPWSGGGEN